jgi:hypothetical protein
VIDRRFLVAALAALVGCGAASDAPTAAPPSGATRLGVAVISGASEQGFVGEPLANSVTIQVVDSAGRAVDGARRIRFTAGAGSVSDTSLLTAGNGTASVIWRLGTAQGQQVMEVSVADTGSRAEHTRVFAEGLSPNAADRVVIRGMTSGSVGLVIRQDAFTWNYTLIYPDTVLRLLPRGPANDGPAGSASWQEVTAFSLGHPPATRCSPGPRASTQCCWSFGLRLPFPSRSG